MAWGLLLVPLLGGAVLAEEGQELECLIEPKVTVALSTPVEGVIEKVHVDRGDFVKRGQIVVELESDVERAIVERARVSLEFAERERTRNEELNKTNVISVQDLDESQSAAALARVDLQRARAALAERRIRSPVNGVVVKRHYSPGEYADTRPILEIAQVDPLHIEVFAPVSALGSIRSGMSATVIPEGSQGRGHQASVTVVDPVVDAASGTFGVRLELPNPDHLVPAGLNCRVRFAPQPVPAEFPPQGSDDGGGSVPAPETEEAPEAALPAVGARAVGPAVDVAPIEPEEPEPFGPPRLAGQIVEEASTGAGAIEIEPGVTAADPVGPIPDSVPAGRETTEPEPAVGTEPAPAGSESRAAEPESDPTGAAAPRGATTRSAGTKGRVARAIFATGIVQREPVDSIDRLTNDHPKVFFFTELHGMQGQTVTHRWEFQDRVVAEVPFAVGGWRWRVYSRKTLFPGQIGAWRASVVGPDGDLLETRTLRYVAATRGATPPSGTPIE